MEGRLENSFTGIEVKTTPASAAPWASSTPLTISLPLVEPLFWNLTTAPASMVSVTPALSVA
jgi:hypothetical protein